MTNFHRPQFIEKPEVPIKLKENVSVGTIISKVVAVDYDCYEDVMALSYVQSYQVIWIVTLQLIC